MLLIKCSNKLTIQTNKESERDIMKAMLDASQLNTVKELCLNVVDAINSNMSQERKTDIIFDLQRAIASIKKDNK
jgi:hypothetical protein